MNRCVKWIEQRIDSFFKLNAFLWLTWGIVGIIMAIYLIGWPKNSMATWNNFQWYLFKQNIIYSFIALLICSVCFARKYFIFPFVVVYLLRLLPFDLSVFVQILEGNAVSLSTNLLGVVFDQILFILGILGTILWARKIFYK